MGFTLLKHCSSGDSYECDIGASSSVLGVLGVLGRGAKSTVVNGLRVRDGKRVAVKIVSLNTLSVREFEMLNYEIHALHKINSANVHGVVQLLDVVNDRIGNRVFLIFNMCKIELFELLEHKHFLTEEKTITIVLQLAKILAKIHDLNIVHGDLKTENVMFDESDNVILIDFGFAEYVPNGHFLTRRAGSIHYVSPELLNGKPFDGKANDMWALGVMMYTIVTGRLPFYVNNRNGKLTKRGENVALYRRIRTGLFKDPNVSQPIYNIINGLINVNVTERLTAHDVVLMLDVNVVV